MTHSEHGGIEELISENVQALRARYPDCVDYSIIHHDNNGHACGVCVENVCVENASGDPVIITAGEFNRLTGESI